MEYYIQRFKNWKCLYALVFCYLLSLDLVWVSIVIRKISIILAGLPKYLPQMLAIETSGIPGFSQAELIVVMGTIGIVAMQALPGMITDQQRHCIILQLKRDYAMYSTGFYSAITENGSPDTWGANGATGLSDINNVLSKYFKMSKNCGTDSGCFPDVNYANLKGNAGSTKLDEDPQYTKFRLMNGSSIAISQTSSDCTTDWGTTPQLQSVCGTLLLDINADKKPNTYGRDLFGFAITKYGLLPLGSSSQTKGHPFSSSCSTNSNANFKYENGIGCTAWVLSNENMDYLDCKGLNWTNGKTTCDAN